MAGRRGVRGAGRQDWLDARSGERKFEGQEGCASKPDTQDEQEAIRHTKQAWVWGGPFSCSPTHCFCRGTPPCPLLPSWRPCSRTLWGHSTRHPKPPNPKTPPTLPLHLVTAAQSALPLSNPTLCSLPPKCDRTPAAATVRIRRGRHKATLNPQTLKPRPVCPCSLPQLLRTLF